MGQVCSSCYGLEKLNKEHEITTSNIISDQKSGFSSNQNSQNLDQEKPILEAIKKINETQIESSSGSGTSKENIKKETDKEAIKVMNSLNFVLQNKELSRVAFYGISFLRAELISILNSVISDPQKWIFPDYALSGFAKHASTETFSSRKNNINNSKSNKMKGGINEQLNQKEDILFVIDEGEKNNKIDYYLSKVPLKGLLKPNAVSSICKEYSLLSKFTLQELRHTFKVCVLNPEYAKYVHFCCIKQKLNAYGVPSISEVSKIISFDELKAGIGEELFAEYESRIKNKNMLKTDDPNILPLKK